MQTKWILLDSHRIYNMRDIRPALRLTIFVVFDYEFSRSANRQPAEAIHGEIRSFYDRLFFTEQVESRRNRWKKNASQVMVGERKVGERKKYWLDPVCLDPSEFHLTFSDAYIVRIDGFSIDVVATHRRCINGTLIRSRAVKNSRTTGGNA